MKFELKHDVPFPGNVTAVNEKYPFSQMKHGSVILFKCKNSNEPLYKSIYNYARLHIKKNKLSKVMKFDFAKLKEGTYGIWRHDLNPQTVPANDKVKPSDKNKKSVENDDKLPKFKKGPQGRISRKYTRSLTRAHILNALKQSEFNEKLAAKKLRLPQSTFVRLRLNKGIKMKELEKAGS